jgi:hypothetical protein
VWADSFAALVPGEVLVFHAYAVQWVTDGTEITKPVGAVAILCISLVLCVALYIGGLYLQGKKMFGGWDVFRIIIVLLAFGC